MDKGNAANHERDWLYFSEAAKRLSTAHGYKISTRQVGKLVTSGALREIKRPEYDRAWRRVALNSVAAYEARIGKHGVKQLA
jgi:hypothetical protein